MIYIVTIKLPKNTMHDPKNKKTSHCVSNPVCTDSTGEHHSFLVNANSLKEIRDYYDGVHITRIELSAPVIKL